MLSNKLIDGIIKEPAGGAHSDPSKIFETVKSEVLKHTKELESKSPEQRIDERIEKFSSMGVIKE
jgi:acetyl-CoA carboxylase carboxyl transferase subunit alpha